MKPNKGIAFFIIVLCSPILGALYGILHDQLTFTLSQEYYTQFKFHQFGLTQENGVMPASPRMLVAVVGIIATWWMGLIIGIFLALVGLILKDGMTMLRVVTKAILITIGIAFFVGLLGFFYGTFSLMPEATTWRIPEGVIEQQDFIAVGSMHNASYLGGLIGMLGGILYIYWEKRKHT